MRSINRWRPAPGTVLGLIAIFISLGGVSYGVATGSIDSRELKNNSIRGKDIRNSTVTGKDIRTGSVAGTDIKNNSLSGRDVLESSLGTVPSANSASSANTANFAGFSGATAGLLHTSPVTMAADGPDKNIFPETNGFQVFLRCTGGVAIAFVKNVSAGDDASADGDEASGEGDQGTFVQGAEMPFNNAQSTTNIDEVGQFAAFGHKGALSGEVAVASGQTATGADCAANGHAIG